MMYGMITWYAFVFFVLGAIVASFIGVIAGRLYTGEGFIKGRSRCDACGAHLPPSTLVPIISYVVLGARARCCGARLTPLSPLSEAVLGALFALAYLKLGFTLGLVGVLVSLALLAALVLYDLAHQVLPPLLLGAFVIAAACTSALTALSWTMFGWTALTAFVIASFLALIHFVSLGRAMGFADAPLALGLALLAGPVAVSGFVLAFWIGALVGIMLLALRPRRSRMNTEVPFAPFLAAGFLLAYFTQWNLFALAAVLLAGN